MHHADSASVCPSLKPGRFWPQIPNHLCQAKPRPHCSHTATANTHLTVSPWLKPWAVPHGHSTCAILSLGWHCRLSEGWSQPLLCFAILSSPQRSKNTKGSQSNFPPADHRSSDWPPCTELTYRAKRRPPDRLAAPPSAWAPRAEQKSLPCGVCHSHGSPVSCAQQGAGLGTV